MGHGSICLLVNLAKIGAKTKKSVKSFSGGERIHLIFFIVVEYWCQMKISAVGGLDDPEKETTLRHSIFLLLVNSLLFFSCDFASSRDADNISGGAENRNNPQLLNKTGQAHPGGRSTIVFDNLNLITTKAQQGYCYCFVNPCHSESR